MERELYFLIRNIRVPVTFSSNQFHDDTAIDSARRLYKKQLAGKFGEAQFHIYKKSVDARNKNNIVLIYTVAAKPCTLVSTVSLKNIAYKRNENYEVYIKEQPDIPNFSGRNNIANRPVVVGFGPSGMFCSYILALAGLEPIVIERGSDVDARSEAVQKYWSTGIVDAETNVQFGEGGAGTFSDGKLLTRISDPLCSFVLETFVKFGAPQEIKYLAKPHVGTDLLRNVVKKMREEIVRLGGTVKFNSKLTGLTLDSASAVTSVKINSSFELPTKAVFLCIGHSARDTFDVLVRNGVTISPKPFSVGVRIEHLQEDIDKALYGDFAGCDVLGKAQYTLSAKKNERAVYSFCMCPGGTVVASASENGQIVTNGMSYYARDLKNANSAIAVSINPSDYGNTVSGAMDFQRNIENAAFALAGADGSAPVQLLGDFVSDTVKNEPNRILPSYTGKTRLCNLKSLFPEYVSDMLDYGFKCFERNINGFSVSDAVLTAPETRTSSPVRINRGENGVSVSCPGLYPCGEGAGYAGGITSAAVDGIRSALEYMKKLL